MIYILGFSPVRLLLPNRNTLSSPRQPTAAGRVPAPTIVAVRNTSGGRGRGKGGGGPGGIVHRKNDGNKNHY